MTQPVTVFVDSADGVDQPESFRCCPLGVQFYSEKELTTYEIMEFHLQAPEGVEHGLRGPTDCTGVVVHCQKDIRGDKYRVWLMFLDLPDAIREQLQCFGKTGDFLCPHCENY